MENLEQYQKAKRKKGFYAFDDVPDPGLPSVTTLLQIVNKPLLVNWAAKVEREAAIDTAASMWEEMSGKVDLSRSGFITSMNSRMGKTKQHQRKLAAAGDIGTAVHKHVEYILRTSAGQVVGTPEPLASPEARDALSNFLQWNAKHTIKPILFEQVVRHLPNYYAGTLDLYAEIPELAAYPLVIDWKTAKGIYFESAVQTSMYAAALKWMGHAPGKVGALVVRLPKSSTESVETKLYTPEEVDHYAEVGNHVVALWQAQRDWTTGQGYEVAEPS